MYMYICVYIILPNGPHFKSGKLNNWTLDSTCIKKKAIRDMLLNTVYLIEFYMIMSFAGLCVNFKRNHRNLSKWGIL